MTGRSRDEVKPAKSYAGEVRLVLSDVIDHAELGQCRLGHKQRYVTVDDARLHLHDSASQAKADHHMEEEW